MTTVLLVSLAINASLGYWIWRLKGAKLTAEAQKVEAKVEKVVDAVKKAV